MTSLEAVRNTIRNALYTAIQYHYYSRETEKESAKEIKSALTIQKYFKMWRIKANYRLKK